MSLPDVLVAGPECPRRTGVNHESRRRSAEASRRARRGLITLATLSWTGLFMATGPVLAADANERKFIREGMAEGEVLFRLGKPDHESFLRNERGHPEEKTWTYFPAYGDAQTLTILTFRAGVVVKVERKIAR